MNSTTPHPFVSILIPSYNSAKYIEKTLQSCFDQTVGTKNFEIIIVDDGSTDESPALIKKCIQGHANVSLYAQKNSGVGPSRNTLLQKLGPRTEWITWLDADDFISERYLECFYNWYHHHRTDENIVRANRKLSSKRIARQMDRKMLYKMDDRILNKIIKRELVDDFQFSNFKYGIEDWDFYSQQIPKIREVSFRDPDFWYFYTFDLGSVTRQNVLYRSRLEHAIYIMSHPQYRANVLQYHVTEHYYSHLWMEARIWFPDLLKQVEAIRYKTREPLRVKLQYYLVRTGLFNKLIRKMFRVINQ